MIQRKTFRAFTLIELLVVIAIIAILAAILFPVFAQAREAARTSSCLSNEKQVSLGILQYVQDYDERFPIWMYTTNLGTPDLPWGPWANNHMGWDKQIYPYVKNVQVYKCPDTGDGIYTTANDTCGGCAADDQKPTGATDYYMNAHLAGRDDAANQKLAKVRYPAVTILIGETSRAASTGAIDAEIDWEEWGWQGGHAHRLNGDNYAGTGNGPDFPNYDALCHQGVGTEWGDGTTSLRHHKGGNNVTSNTGRITGGGANYAHVDGHVKFYPGDATCVVWKTGSPKQNESGNSLTYIP